MRGYLSPERINRWPVLMVVWDREAEEVFQEVGREDGVAMLTTTVERVARRSLVLNQIRIGRDKGDGVCVWRLGQ